MSEKKRKVKESDGREKKGGSKVERHREEKGKGRNVEEKEKWNDNLNKMLPKTFRNKKKLYSYNVYCTRQKWGVVLV